MSISSLLATPYRFEISTKDVDKWFHERRKQEAHITEVYKRGLKVESEHSVDKDRWKGVWEEEYAEILARADCKAENKKGKRELAHENKASIIVRRAALRHQMEEELRGYRAELRNLGKAFHTERL